jgi:hypothetical protein
VEDIMISRRFYICYALIFAAFTIATGCCCKTYDEPYSMPTSTSGPVSSGVLYAGVEKVEITPEIGVPLAGWSGRRLSFPDIWPFNYHTYFKPSEGTRDSLYAKSLVLDNGSERVCIVTLDAGAADGEVVDLAHRKAAARGFSIPREKVLFCASHTHSGPGAMTNKRLWIYAAADQCVNRVREDFTDKIAESMVGAEANMIPAKIGVGTVSVTGVTKNRRTTDSGHVDDQLGIIRVDKLDGSPLATVWNFAIHGTIYRADNLKYSTDIMGEVSAFVEGNGGGIALFINGAEGDIAPDGGVADIPQIRDKIGDAIIDTRNSLTPSMQSWVELEMAHEKVNFGNPQIDASVYRVNSVTGGEIDVLVFLDAYDIDIGTTVTLSSSWVENELHFQAIRIGKTLLSSVPGEPIYDVGSDIRTDALGMGYEKVFICSLANNHMGYVTTETEYNICGYEGFATFFGPTTGKKVKEACSRVAAAIKP